MQLQPVTLHPGVQPVLNTGGTHAPNGPLPQPAIPVSRIVSNWAVPPSWPMVGIRQSLWPAKFDALSCPSQLQMVVDAPRVGPNGSTLHVPELHSAQPSAPPVAAEQIAAAKASGWQRGSLPVHSPGLGLHGAGHDAQPQKPAQL